MLETGALFLLKLAANLLLSQYWYFTACPHGSVQFLVELRDKAIELGVGDLSFDLKKFSAFVVTVNF